MSNKTTQKITNSIFILSGVITLLILIIVVGFILIKGFNVIDIEFLFSNPEDSGRDGGIFPMIISSILLIIIASAISIPIGVGSAIYISQYPSNKRLISLIRFISQVLSSIPSIVFGLFGLSFLIFYLKWDWSIFSGGVVLALMSIPTIYQTSELSLQNVPEIYKEGCYAMGVGKWDCIKSIILPIALPGIFTGIMLAIMRAISEAAAVMYVVGSSLDIPISIFDTGRPLPLHLYVLATEGISMSNAFGTAAVLVIIVLVITVISNFLIDYYQTKKLGV